MDLEKERIARAVAGEQEALEELLGGVQDMVFNLSLRMLGLVPDAEDATQEILIKVMTRLSTFRQESSLSTWVFRIAVNHLRDVRKSRFDERPLSFEYYGADIAGGREQGVGDLSGGVDRRLLEQELKHSCTNVMLQCLDPQSRCIFVLGTMFRLDSRIAAEILELTPEAYRQRLSRIRRKVADFLSEYCGLSGTGRCSCRRRVDYAIAQHRIDPGRLEFQPLQEYSLQERDDFTEAMEQLDAASQVFTALPHYRAPQKTRDWIRSLIASREFNTVLGGREEAVCR